MRELDAIADGLLRELDAQDAARERTLALSRAVIRASGQAIRALHRGDDAGGHLEEARSLAQDLLAASGAHVELASAPFVRDALGEMVEALLLDAFLAGRPPSAPDEMGVPPASYVMGLGDLVGELRRLAVTRLRSSEVDEADRILATMESLTDTLMRFDQPDALVPVRRKQDVARSVVERTRGEVALARTLKRTQEKVDSVHGLLDQLENQPAPRKAKKRPGDEDKELDIDSVW